MLKGRFTHSMPFPCHAVPLWVWNVSYPFDLHSAAVSDSHLPCRAANGLECVFSIWFTKCGRVWFTLAMPFFSRPQHGCREMGMLWPWEERHGLSMASVNQTRLHCVNQIGKTYSKPLAARHAMCESALNNTVNYPSYPAFILRFSNCHQLNMAFWTTEYVYFEEIKECATIVM